MNEPSDIWLGDYQFRMSVKLTLPMAWLHSNRLQGMDVRSPSFTKIDGVTVVELDRVVEGNDYRWQVFQKDEVAFIYFNAFPGKEIVVDGVPILKHPGVNEFPG